MSSAYNHAARSRRSYARHRSAAGGVRMAAAKVSANKYGTQSAPLIFRLQAFRRKILECRKRPAEEEA